MTALFRRPVGAIGHDDTVVALVRARGGQWGKGYEIGSPNAGSPSASIGSDNRSGPGECVNTPRSVADTALGGAHVQDRSAFAAGDQVSPPEDRAS